MAGTGVGKFSSTAGNNTSNMTVNFAENMAPSNVNNAARELMAHIYDMYKQLGDGYFEYGDGDATYTVARSDADTITITSSSDISSIYFPGRKIRITDGGANVVEGTIASSSHASTTQTVNLTGISLASGTPTKVELGIDTAAFGGRVILDDDGDTYIEAPTDDQIDIYVGGNAVAKIAAGEVSFNENSVDTDFRVESNGNQNMLFVDGNNDHVNIGTSTAYAGKLNIETDDNSFNLFLVSTDADANSGPNMKLYRNSGSPADNDILGNVYFTGRNDNSQDVDYAQIETLATDVSDGAEDGYMNIYVAHAGTKARSRIEMDSTEMVINEGGADLDFRVESDSNANAFFLEGSTGNIGIGTGSPINTSGYAGLSLNSTTGGIIDFIDDGTQKVRIVGSNAEASIQYTGSFNLVSGLSGGRQVFSIDNSGSVAVNGTNANLTFSSDGNTINFGRNADNTISSNGGTSSNIVLNAQNRLVVQTDSTERFRVTSAGIHIGGTGSANALDDYEEGTWTPTLVSDAGAGGYTTRVGNYTKTGRTCVVSCQVRMSSVGSFAGATTSISGLPFTSANISNDFIGNIYTSATANDLNRSYIRIPGNNATIVIEKSNGDTGVDNSVNANHFDTGTTIRITATYMTA